ncbi:PorV/PorQ family protein [Elusimicrobiota bacterium]
MKSSAKLNGILFFHDFFCYLLLLSTVYCLLSTAAHAAGPGATSGTSLKNDIGAKSAAMGGAFTAHQGDINCLSYNPAGIAPIETREVSLSHTNSFVDTTYNSILFAMPSRYGGFGASINYFDAGKLELVMLDGTEKTVKAQQDIAAGISWGARADGIADYFEINTTISFGVTLKYFSSEIAEAATAKAYTGDIGMILRIFETTESRLNFGAAAQNLTGTLKYISDEESLPRQIRSGFSLLTPIGMERFSGMLNADVIYQMNEKKTHPRIGLELATDNYAFRIGNKFNYGAQSLSLGCGYIREPLKIDYAFSLARDLDDQHRITLGVGF